MYPSSLFVCKLALEMFCIYLCIGTFEPMALYARIKNLNLNLNCVYRLKCVIRGTFLLYFICIWACTFNDCILLTVLRRRYRQLYMRVIADSPNTEDRSCKERKKWATASSYELIYGMPLLWTGSHRQFHLELVCTVSIRLLVFRL
jgi:hypothetical protein